MNEFDLDKLKLKTSEELTPLEKDYIKENVDKLNDEDKEAYASFLTDATDDEEDSNADTSAGDGSGGGDGHSDDAGKKEDDGAGKEDAAAGGYTFKNEEEARAFVQKTVEEENKKQRQAAIDAAKTPEEKKYVEDNWRPKNWNEGLEKAAEVAMKKIEEKQQKEAEAQKTNKERFEKEWDGIVEANKLPKRDTEEGQKVLRSVYDVGIKYNQPSFTKAYDLWSKLPEDQGGGLKTDGKTKPAPKSNPNREAAAKIRGNTQGGEKTATAAPKNYQDLHGKTVSQLVRDAGKALS